MASLLGTWNYRSFFNRAKPVTSPEEALALIFGEGELDVVKSSPDDGFVATLSFGGDAVMDLTGTVISPGASQPLVINVNGKGRADSAIADYRYDYLFFEVPAWPAGIGQQQTMVGSVVRAADHGTARKGATASTIAVRRDA